MAIVDMPDVPSAFFTAFNDIEYHDEPHKYYINGKQLVSTTTLIHKYADSFDEEYWSEYKADESGLSKRDVIRCWRHINEKATIKGSAIHDYIENLFNNKVFPYPIEKIKATLGDDIIRNNYDHTLKQVLAFYKAVKDILIPIKTEYVIYDETYGISGMVDLLVYNVRTGKFEIWDWKTNKLIKMDGTYCDDPTKVRKMKGILSHIDDCEMETYSIQLHTYKYIIERNIGIELGDPYIVHFNQNAIKFAIHKVNDRREEVKAMFGDYMLR
jgi:ATP-dependent exoDNAse (exonuclease V) beta subunit